MLEAVIEFREAPFGLVPIHLSLGLDPRDAIGPRFYILLALSYLGVAAPQLFRQAAGALRQHCTRLLEFPNLAGQRLVACGALALKAVRELFDTTFGLRPICSGVDLDLGD